MKRIATAILAVVTLALIAPLAHAHTLITDQTGTYGAILHINPDDDPIAGKKATLYLDIQGRVLDGGGVVRLSITYQSNDETGTVETKTEGSLVSAYYTFPKRGIYEIRYDVEAASGKYVFQQTTRVSRGESASRPSQVRHIWAEGLFVACLVALCSLAIVAWNQRSDIGRHSKF